MHSKHAAAAIAAICLPGCATGPFEWKYGSDKIVPGQFAILGDRGSVLTWPSHAVGAVVYPGTTGACIQSAQSAKSRSSSGAGGLSVKIPEGPEGSINLAQAISEAVALLQDKNDVATFTDISLFQVCTIAANNKLTAAQSMELVRAVMTAAVDIARARPNTVRERTTTVTAPAPAAAATARTDKEVVKTTTD